MAARAAAAEVGTGGGSSSSHPLGGGRVNAHPPDAVAAEAEEAGAKLGAAAVVEAAGRAGRTSRNTRRRAASPRPLDGGSGNSVIQPHVHSQAVTVLIRSLSYFRYFMLQGQTCAVSALMILNVNSSKVNRKS